VQNAGVKYYVYSQKKKMKRDPFSPVLFAICTQEVPRTMQF